MTDPHDAIPEIALDWHRQGRAVALAMVVETWGSAPRPAGSLLVVDEAGEMMGSVSGGCVEGAVVSEAPQVLHTGNPRLLEYGVVDDDAIAVGLACGGRIRVLLTPVGRGQGLPVSVLAALAEARADRQGVALAIDLRTWAHRLAGPDDGDLGAAVAAALAADRAGLAGDWFLGIHNPPVRLIVVGAVHIAQPLVQMARLCGYDPVIIDPRPAFGSAARFADQVIVDEWPDDALSALAPDARTAIVTLTHDPKLDDPAITAALRGPAFYIGALGSTRTHAGRVQRLRSAGVAEADIARIHAPVGLDIGASSPAEIALSVMAQITLRLRRPVA